MSYAKQMLDTYPRTFNLDADQLAATTEALYDCAQACTACADACLSEENVTDLVKCIQLNLNCDDICVTAGRALSPPDRVRRQPHQGAARGLRADLPLLR